MNECGTPLPDVFLARWCDSFYTPEQAVSDTLEHWAHMVMTTFKEEVENAFEPEWGPDQLLKQLAKVTLKPNPEFVKELISIAEGRYDARSLGDVPVEQLLFELLPAGSEFSDGSSGLERLKAHLHQHWICPFSISKAILLPFLTAITSICVLVLRVPSPPNSRLSDSHLRSIAKPDCSQQPPTLISDPSLTVLIYIRSA